MKKTEKPSWTTKLNFDNTKKPLNDIRIALELIKKDYEKKHKELKRLSKGVNGNTTM